MDAVFSRRKLIEPKALRELMQRSDMHGAMQAGSHFGAILLTGLLLAWDVGQFLGCTRVYRAWHTDQFPLRGAA